MSTSDKNEPLSDAEMVGRVRRWLSSTKERDIDRRWLLRACTLAERYLDKALVTPSAERDSNPDRQVAVEVDGGVHVRTAKQWVELARADLRAPACVVQPIINNDHQWPRLTADVTGMDAIRWKAADGNYRWMLHAEAISARQTTPSANRSTEGVLLPPEFTGHLYDALGDAPLTAKCEVCQKIRALVAP